MHRNFIDKNLGKYYFHRFLNILLKCFPFVIILCLFQVLPSPCCGEFGVSSTKDDSHMCGSV